MAKPAKKSQKKQRRGDTRRLESLPFSKRNYQIFGLGIIVLILGYIALGQGPVDGFMTLTVAPILLVLGYVVIIPLSILYGAYTFLGKKKEPQEQTAAE